MNLDKRYRYRFLIIAVIVDNKMETIGYRVVQTNDPNLMVSDLTLNQVQAVGANTDFVSYDNAEFDSKYGVLVGTNGILNTYPKIDLYYNVRANMGTTLCKLLEAHDSNNIVGALIYTPAGKPLAMGTKDIEKLPDRNIKFTNFTLNLGNYASLNGSRFAIHKMQPPKAKGIVNSKSEGKDMPISEMVEDKDELQEIPITSLQDINTVGKQFFDDAQRTFLQARLAMRQISPYFHSLLDATHIVPVKDWGTLGVTEDRMYYDIGFVASITIEELTYILIHEMMHLSMQHSIRFGTRTNHDMWNIACDLYINTLISNTFTEVLSDGTIKYCTQGQTINVNGKQLKCPEIGIHLGLKGKDTLDISRESPETIYNQLMKENPLGPEINGVAPETPDILSVDTKNNGMSAEQQSLMQAIIEKLARQLSAVIEDLKEQKKLVEKDADTTNTNLSVANARLQKLIQLGQTTDAKITEEKVNSIRDIFLGLKDSIGKIATDTNIIYEDARKLASGSIKRTTADNIVTDLQKVGRELQKIGVQTAKPKIKDDGKTVLDIADELEKLAKQVPKRMDMSQQQQGQGQANMPQIGITPDEIENAQAQQGQGLGQGQQAKSQGGQGGNDSDGNNGNDSQNGQQGQSQSSGGSDTKNAGTKDSGKYGKGTAMNQQGNQQGNNQNGQGSGASSDGQQSNQHIVEVINGEGKTIKSHTKSVKVKYNGQTLEGKVNMDILTNNSKKDGNTVEANKAATKAALSRIKTKLQMDRDAGKFDGDGDGCGSGSNSYCDREIEFGLANDIDWHRILKKVCTVKPKEMYVSSRPNRKLMNMGITRPSKRPVGTEKTIRDIKICIDISGSVSSQQLNRYLSEVASLLKLGKDNVTGELIYWSTDVGSSGDFSKFKDLLQVNPTTTGGTDVKCVFEYLNGEVGTLEEPNKREKSKLKDVPLVMIVTDGGFYNNYSQYKDKFDKKVVWIIDGDARTFNPPFGKVASLTSKN